VRDLPFDFGRSGCAVRPTLRVSVWAPVLLAPILFACPGTPTGEERVENPPVTLYGVHLQYYRGSQLYTSGRTAKLSYQRSTADFTGTEALLRFPPRSEQLSDVEVIAPELAGNMVSKQVDGTGGVVLRTGTGLVGKTPSAHFDGAAATARGTQHIDVVGPGYALSSDAFTFDFSRERFVFDGNVKSELGGKK
jgi:lipopolysaccharide export system protein LptC